MSDPLSRAMADLASKENDIARLQAEAEKLRVFIEMYQSYAGKPLSNGDDRSEIRSKKDKITDVAITIIRDRGVPVPTRILQTEIEAKGVEIGTSDPKQYLSTIFNRDIRFRSIRGEGWVLAD
jgi:hypothetical protein